MSIWFGVHALLVLALVGGVLGLSALLGERHPSEPATGATYEGGQLPSRRLLREDDRSLRRDRRPLDRRGRRRAARGLPRPALAPAGASSATWALVIVLVPSSVIGLFYYLRIVSVMCTRVEGTAVLLPRVPARAEVRYPLTVVLPSRSPYLPFAA